MYITKYVSSCILAQCYGEKRGHKGIRRVANLKAVCPRHIEFGLSNARVASGQREPST